MPILASGLWACNSDDTATSNNTTTEKTVMSAKTQGEELPSFEEWQEMISIHKQTSDMILEQNTPEDIDVEEYKRMIMEGTVELEKPVEEELLLNSKPLINYGRLLSEKFDIEIDSTEELLFLSTFSPEENLNEEFPMTTYGNGLGWQDFVECGMIALGVDFLYAAGVESHSSKWTKKAATKAFGKIATRMLGPVGTTIAVATFGYCLYERY